MGVFDFLGSLFGGSGPNIHVDVLSGNKNEGSPRSSEKIRVTKKDKTIDKSKTVDRSKQVDKSHDNDNSYIDQSVTNNNYFLLELPRNLQANALPQELQPLVNAYKNKEIAFVGEDNQAELSSLLRFEKEDTHAKGVLTFLRIN